MSAYLVGRMLWAELPVHLKLTAVIIADAANDEGFAYPGLKRIAEQLGQGRRQAQYNIRALEQIGVVTTASRGRPGGGRSSNSYQINVDILPHPPTAKAQPIAPLVVGKGATHCASGGEIGRAKAQPIAPSKAQPIARECEPSDQTHQRREEHIGEKSPTAHAADRGPGLRRLLEALAQEGGEGRSRESLGRAHKARKAQALAHLDRQPYQNHELQFVPNPATYLRGARWEDEEVPRAKVNGSRYQQPTDGELKQWGEANGYPAHDDEVWSTFRSRVLPLYLAAVQGDKQ